MAEPHPFTPGTRVAKTDGWDNWHEGFVEKLHKSGRFTLKGSAQQWRVVQYSDGELRAFPTGDPWSRAKLRLWDDAADLEIKEIFASQARRKRWAELRLRVERVRDHELSDAMLDQIDDALLKKSLTAEHQS